MTAPGASSVARAGARSALARLRLGLGVAVWRHGWLWPLAGLLCLCAGGGAAFFRFDTERDATQLLSDTAELATLRAAVERRDTLAPSALLKPDTDVRRDQDRQALLTAVLVPRDQPTDALRRIYELGAQQQVLISQAQFQSEVGAGGIERLQIRIPAKARYPQLRRFVEAALRDLPNASLDGLSFRRNQVGDAQIEAQLSFSLWLQAQAVAPAGGNGP